VGLRSVGLSAVTHGAARGEKDSPDPGSLERSGSCRCKNPMRVVLPVSFGLPSGVGRARRRPMDTPRRRRSLVARLVTAKARGRSAGEGPCKAGRRTTLEGKSPREHPAVGELTPAGLPGIPGRVKARKPRLVGPAHPLWRGGIPTRETVRGFIYRGNAAGTFREEKAPKGESQERRRYEKRPAGARREQTVERVTKP
jgi:hypothetical protein